MKRLYFLVPDLPETSKIAEELEANGLKHEKIHVVGKDITELQNANILPANVLQTSNLKSALLKGAIFGICLVLLIYGLLAFTLPSDVKLNALAYLGIFIFSFGFAIWSSGFVGFATKNPVVEKNQNYVESGHYILMVDVPVDRAKEINQKIVAHHPGIRVASSEQS